ncbi:hypothetical protein E2C01_001660 [Portunus trituberculatus]|uniref:Uncharacterized protein n=1 Tax=Portunus trituberculatus TaxID=210409 RepID=A0A5B7CIM4_PORTR|nr:hypothetical protein [Portunus trituberculatus]
MKDLVQYKGMRHLGGSITFRGAPRDTGSEDSDTSLLQYIAGVSRSLPCLSSSVTTPPSLCGFVSRETRASRHCKHTICRAAAGCVARAGTLAAKGEEERPQQLPSSRLILPPDLSDSFFPQSQRERSFTTLALLLSLVFASLYCQQVE